MNPTKQLLLAMAIVPLVALAAPMVGGMVTAPLLSMFVVPAVYYLLRSRHVKATSSLSSKLSLQEDSQ